MNTKLPHPILPIRYHFRSKPSVTISEKLLTALDDWSGENDTRLIPGYEGPGADGIGIAIQVPEYMDTKVFADALLAFVHSQIHIVGSFVVGAYMRQTFKTIGNKGRWLVFPRLIVAI
jgi:hypothetical protein